MKFLKRIFCFSFIKTHFRKKNSNKDEDVNEINSLNLNDESNNPDNINNETDISREQRIHEEQIYGLCSECNQPNTDEYWCKECNSKIFQQNFDNWTSGNKQIDKFIQESQLNARTWFELLEWIPYNRLRNIKYLAQGGFSTVYKAIWLNGRIMYWDYEGQDWERGFFVLVEQDYKDASNSLIKNPLKSNEEFGYSVVLKSLNDSSNISEDFLNEWKLHLQCQNEAFLNYTLLNSILGITQDPATLNYMIVMEYKFDGSLRNNLLTKKYNLNDKFQNLWSISSQLKAIHKLNLVHGDLHNGNILHSDCFLYISDLGLCRPVTNIKNEIYGVIPYMAPEVLRGKPYTKAADIYSFGIIMWEMTSGVPAFHNIPHDLDLSLDICRGIRPEIIGGTMPEYVEIMKRCWDNDPEKRPTANELDNIFWEWMEKYPIENDEEKRILIPENEPKIIYHPNTCYISRKFNDSAKLNDIFELSVKILFDNNDNHNKFDETDDMTHI